MNVNAEIEIPNDEQVAEALAKFNADNAPSAPTPIVNVAPVGVTEDAPAEVPAAPVAEASEENDSVLEKDLPASLTLRHTVPSFMETYNCDKVEAQNVLNWLVRINEVKRIKLVAQKGIGKGRRPTVYALPAKLEFGLEV